MSAPLKIERFFYGHLAPLSLLFMSDISPKKDQKTGLN